MSKRGLRGVPRLPIQYGTRLHNVLLLAAGNNQRPITMDQVMDVFTKMTSKYDVRQVFLSLEAKGCLKSLNNNQWVITQRGQVVLSDMAYRRSFRQAS